MVAYLKTETVCLF